MPFEVAAADRPENKSLLAHASCHASNWARKFPLICCPRPPLLLFPVIYILAMCPSFPLVPRSPLHPHVFACAAYILTPKICQKVGWIREKIGFYTYHLCSSNCTPQSLQGVELWWGKSGKTQNHLTLLPTVKHTNSVDAQYKLSSFRMHCKCCRPNKYLKVAALSRLHPCPLHPCQPQNVGRFRGETAPLRHLGLPSGDSAL